MERQRGGTEKPVPGLRGEGLAAGRGASQRRGGGWREAGRPGCALPAAFSCLRCSSFLSVVPFTPSRPCLRPLRKNCGVVANKTCCGLWMWGVEETELEEQALLLTASPKEYECSLQSPTLLKIWKKLLHWCRTSLWLSLGHMWCWGAALLVQGEAMQPPPLAALWTPASWAPCLKCRTLFGIKEPYSFWWQPCASVNPAAAC